MKTKFVVIDENIFGCVNPNQPDQVQVLSSSVIRGASCDRMGGMRMLPYEGVRPASCKDFETFRISSKGYEKDTEYYDFPAF